MSPELWVTIIVAIIGTSGGVTGLVALRKLSTEKKALEAQIVAIKAKTTATEAETAATLVKGVYGEILDDLRTRIDEQRTRIGELEKKLDGYYQENLRLRLEVEQSREYITNLEHQLEIQIEQSNIQIKDLQDRLSIVETERKSLLDENVELKRRLDVKA